VHDELSSLVSTIIPYLGDFINNPKPKMKWQMHANKVQTYNDLWKTQIC